MTAETRNFENPLVIAELKLAFNEVDINKDGFISRQEARRGITLAGERIPGICFDRMVHMFDDNGDGQLSLQEFLSNIKKLS
jgi:Ca2+-binding EF-hand superfamily protein